MKLKRGDKVLLLSINKSITEHSVLQIGNIYTVTRVNTDSNSTMLDGCGAWVDTFRLKYIPQSVTILNQLDQKKVISILDI